MNQQDEQIINNVVQEIQGFLTMLNQSRIGFTAVFSNVMDRLVTEYRNKEMTIESQKQRITSLEKELETFKKC